MPYVMADGSDVMEETDGLGSLRKKLKKVRKKIKSVRKKIIKTVKAPVKILRALHKKVQAPLKRVLKIGGKKKHSGGGGYAPEQEVYEQEAPPVSEHQLDTAYYANQPAYSERGIDADSWAEMSAPEKFEAIQAPPGQAFTSSDEEDPDEQEFSFQPEDTDAEESPEGTDVPGEVAMNENADAEPFTPFLEEHEEPDQFASDQWLAGTGVGLFVMTKPHAAQQVFVGTKRIRPPGLVEAWPPTGRRVRRRRRRGWARVGVRPVRPF